MAAGPSSTTASAPCKPASTSIARKSQDGSRDNAGLYLAFGHGEVDVQHNLLGRSFNGGEDKFDALSVGGYWTHFGPSDWYLDGVVQGTWYDATMTGNRGLRDGETDGWGWPPRSRAAIRSISATAG